MRRHIPLDLESTGYNSLFAISHKLTPQEAIPSGTLFCSTCLPTCSCARYSEIPDDNTFTYRSAVPCAPPIDNTGLTEPWPYRILATSPQRITVSTAAPARSAAHAPA